MNKVQSKYEKAKAYAREKSGKKAIVSESYLRVEKVLKNTTSVYEFDLKEGVGTEPIERKLGLNDSFIITDLVFGIYQRDTTKPYNEVLQTYPNPVHFSGGTNFAPVDLETIYKGILELKVGNTVITESMDLLSFRKVPETQKVSATTETKFCIDEIQRPLEKFQPITGSKSNSLKVQIPMSDGSLNWEHDGTNLQSRVVLIAKGFLIKGINVED